MTMQVKKPNTFVIGVPKCGTTAMAHYMRRHPEAFFSTPKETHHFLAEEMPRRSRCPSAKAYSKLFETASPQQKVIAEGSVWYLYSRTAVANIHKFNSDAKFIIMLRRPDDMVYSMHNQFVIAYYEYITDFGTAWHQTQKNNRTDFSKHCLQPSLLKYDKIAAFGEQLGRVYETVPAEQVKVIFFDDFTEKTDAVFAETCDFLGIDSSFKPKFEKINENQIHRNALLGRLMKHPPAPLRSVVRAFKSTFRIHKLGLKQFIRRFNSKKYTSPTVDQRIQRTNN